MAGSLPQVNHQINTRKVSILIDIFLITYLGSFDKTVTIFSLGPDKLIREHTLRGHQNSGKQKDGILKLLTSFIL